jgi:enoyl-CoA hydratase
MAIDTGTEDVVRYEVEDRCAVITIDRPRARNAISPEVALGIEAAIDAVEADDEVWVAILTGAPPVFCAGADLRAIDDGRGPLLSTERGGFAGIARRERTKPMIAAVEGAALAGGTEIVLSCDLVVAAEDAVFGLPEVKRGLIAAAGGLFRLGRKLPIAVAMECALTGDPIDAPRAHGFGLVNAVSAPGQACEAARSLAARITANAPLAVSESRKVLLAGTPADDETGWQLTEEAYRVVLESADVHEGIQAFIEKRRPEWKGR